MLVLACVGTIEEAILDKARQKRDIDAKVIQAGMFNDRSTNEERHQVCPGRGLWWGERHRDEV